MKSVYFVSDIHFGVGDRQTEIAKTNLFLDLLDEIFVEGAELFIVGDLFDFWFEYTHVLPRGFHRVLAGLERLTANGINITYLSGNHDFSAGSFFENDLGITLYSHDFEMVRNEKRFYLYHGDGLAANDMGYRFLKKVIRSTIAKGAFKILPPDLGFWLAKQFSHSSRDYTSKKYFGDTDGMITEAERRIQRGCDYVIMGHRHVPILHKIDHGFYVNLGDWLKYFTYAVFDGEILHLLKRENNRAEPFHFS